MVEAIKFVFHLLKEGGALAGLAMALVVVALLARRIGILSKTAIETANQHAAALIAAEKAHREALVAELRDAAERAHEFAPLARDLVAAIAQFNALIAERARVADGESATSRIGIAPKPRRLKKSDAAEGGSGEPESRGG